MPENREYKAVQRWCGWLGGFGNNDDVAGFMALQTQGGWRLAKVVFGLYGWCWFVPRWKALFIFER